MRNQKGIALVVALILAVLLSLLALSVTFSSMRELATSTEFENHERALLLADAGFNRERQELRSQELNALLAQSGTVLVVKPDQTESNWAIRNPISPIDARNIDFESTFSSTGTSISVSGLLTPAGGQLIEGGRYFAKLTDNREPDNNPSIDTDGTVFLRVIGIADGSFGEVASYGSGRKNAVAIIEAEIHRDMTFDMTSPMSFLGPHVNAEFGGMPFSIDGYDHENMTPADMAKGGNGQGSDKHDGLSALPAINCLDPTNATGSVTDITDALKGKQDANVVGAGGTPSVVDGSNDLKNSTNPDARNVLDPVYLQSISNQVAKVADLVYEGNQSLGGQGQDVFALGTPADPKITYINGSLDVSGNIVGAGLLVITGDLKGTGSLIYDGLILVLGTGNVTFGGSNNGVLGGLVAANLQGSPPQFGTTSLKVAGNSDFYFRGDSIRMAIRMLPMRIISWREITPEIEPVATVTSTTPTL